MNPVQKGKAVQAREARPSMESGHDNPQPIGNSGPNSPATTVHSSAGRRLSDATQPSKRPSRADTSLSHSTRDPRLQARSAAVPKSEATSDLIDFIREGPPTVGARRIPRTVAPFRTTMDSEDLAYEQGNPSAPSVSSTQGESTATKSEVSVGSRTGLLDSASIKTTQTASSRLHSNSSKMAAGDGTALKRTQRRVPDPYATDWDDEELEAVLKDEKLRGAESSSGKMTVEDGSRPTPTERHVPDPYATDWDDEELEAVLEDGKPQREVESLVDFLRNVPPPAAEPQPKSFAPKSVPSKASTDGPGGSTSAMKARFSRNNSSGRVPSVKSSRTSLRMQWDQQSTGSGYTATVNTERRAGGGRSGMPSVSERQTETSALADFLRNTGPPDPPVSRAPPPKEPSFARRFFVRRKKVEA
ncbi:hypothetical protein BJX61DRAFT_505460 [Aspergillus egyptiacus]|nr:hypothetical protein BJX61DRAFT_505460 [Aspergillus egyptiacus]